MIERTSKIYIAGHTGMVGSAILRKFSDLSFKNIIVRTRKELDLTNFEKVRNFFDVEKPDYVILAAARVGGIGANIKYPVEFLLENLKIQNNVIENAFYSGVKKLIFLGSSCIYPKDSPQPMKEEYLLTGPLEPTNEGYALAKIAGIKLAQYYSEEYGFKVLNIIPPNLYGFNDEFDLSKAHVLSSLVKKFVDATLNNSEKVVVWGNGIARREFMHVFDLVDAILFLDEIYDSPEIINVGTGIDISIKELAYLIAEIVGFRRKIVWDREKPDGMLQKKMDVSKMRKLGFAPKIQLKDGIKDVVKEYYRRRNK